MYGRLLTHRHAQFGKLLPEAHRHLVAGPLAALATGAREAPPSCCHLTLMVALRGGREELGLPAANFWITPGAEPRLAIRTLGSCSWGPRNSCK